MASTSDQAESRVQQLLDERDLYIANSRHERRLLSCVKDLWGTVVAKEPTVAWLDFRRWALANKAKSEEHANVFLAEYLEANRCKPSCSHTVHLYIQAWRSWGIEVSGRIREQIAQFEREEWKPAQLTRRNQQQVNKLRQFESLDKMWTSMVEYMLDVSATDFRALLKSVSSNRGDHTGIASSSFNEIDVVCRKGDAELKGILACTLAYASLLRTTGMRGLTGVNVKLGDFTDFGDGSVVLERWEKKLGSTRNVTKPVYVRIVPGVDPRQDPLVHIAQHAVVNRMGSGDQLFGHGFKRKDHQDDEAFAKCPQRRFIAVLHVVAIACGSAGGLGERRLHAFRVLCDNRLGQLGFSSQERADYVGWQGTVQSQSYSLMKSKAKNSIVPYKMAGRECRDEKPHPMWNLLGDVPGVQLNCWYRVHRLAVAARVLKGSGGAFTIDADAQRQMDDHLKTAARRKMTSTSPKALLKRVRQLERDLQDERSKCAKNDLQLSAPSPSADTADDASESASSEANIDPVQALTELVKSLKADRKRNDFPAICAQALPKITQLIDAGSTTQRTFGLPLSSADGKTLVRILYLAVLGERCPHLEKGDSRSWFGFVDKKKKEHPVLKAVEMTSWQGYRRRTIEDK